MALISHLLQCFSFSVEKHWLLMKQVVKLLKEEMKLDVDVLGTYMFSLYIHMSQQLLTTFFVYRCIHRYRALSIHILCIFYSAHSCRVFWQYWWNWFWNDSLGWNLIIQYSFIQNSAKGERIQTDNYYDSRNFQITADKNGLMASS